MKILQLQVLFIIGSIQSYFGTKTRVEFKDSYSKQDKIAYTHGKMVIKITVETIIQDYIEKCKCFGYGLGLDGHGSYSHPTGGNRRNVIDFGVKMSLSIKIDNRKKDILIWGLCPKQGLEHN